MAQDLFDVGALDEITTREIDTLCLQPKRPLQPRDIHRSRKVNNVSQAALAIIIGAGKTTVQQWEQGKKKAPEGPAGNDGRPLLLHDYYVIIIMRDVIKKPGH
jgi:putative transcriptional regulator